jgi:hypothetical protein
MPISDLFSGARLKIKRADQHIDELNAELTAFVKTDFCEFFVEPDPASKRPILKFHQTVPTPESIPLIIGDILHNLRTSLDYVASEIVRRANGPTRYIKFPFAVRERKWKLPSRVEK